MKRIAIRDYGNEADKVLQAWKLFSEGIRSVVAAGCDQYGPYRCGPTYPLVFDQKLKEEEFPRVGWATHGGFEIWNPHYPETIFDNPEFTLLRYERVQKVEENFRRGCELLNEAVKAIDAENGSEQLRQAGVAGMLHATYVTAGHVMRWTIAKQLLISAVDGTEHACDEELLACIGLKKKDREELVSLLKEIAHAETENVNRALLYYEEDSQIGFECTMEYIFDQEHAAWKNKETERSLERLEEYMQKNSPCEPALLV